MWNARKVSGSPGHPREQFAIPTLTWNIEVVEHWKTRSRRKEATMLISGDTVLMTSKNSDSSIDDFLAPSEMTFHYSSYFNCLLHFPLNCQGDSPAHQEKIMRTSNASSQTHGRGERERQAHIIRLIFWKLCSTKKIYSHYFWNSSKHT